MEKGEPSFVPEWLRKSGGGSKGCNSSHHIASSDGPALASLKRNGYCKHDRNSYVRPYNISSQSRHNNDRSKLDTLDGWDSEFLDYRTSINPGRTRDSLKRSQSMTSRRPSELSQRGAFLDYRDTRPDVNCCEKGAISAASGTTTGIQTASQEMDFPQVGSDERSMPDVTRNGFHSPSIGNEQWTSALAEVPVGAKTSRVSSPVGSNLSPYGGTNTASVPASLASSVSSGLNNVGGLAESAVRSQNGPQQSEQMQRSEELPCMGSKRLVPMPPSLPKTLVLNPSDKLRPKTSIRSNEVVAGTNNGVQQMSSSRLGGGGVKSDGPKLCSTKLVKLKSTRESGVSSNQTVKISDVIANGQLTSASSVTSNPSKNPKNAKLVNQKCPLPHLQSRNNFFEQVRKKSVSNASAAADSGILVSSGMPISDATKELTSDSQTPTENGSEVTCTDHMCNLGENFSDGRKGDVNDGDAIYPDEEEEAFLRSLGWEDSSDEQGGLTEDEINAFVQKVKAMIESDNMKLKQTSILCRGLKLKIQAEADPRAFCPAGVSSKLTTNSSV